MASDRVAEVLEVPLGAWSVRAHGALWVACPVEDRVVRLDPANGAITADIPTGRGPRFLVAASGVWLLNQTRGALDGEVWASAGAEGWLFRIPVDAG